MNKHESCHVYIPIKPLLFRNLYIKMAKIWTYKIYYDEILINI